MSETKNVKGTVIKFAGDIPKYSRPELERRWLVDPKQIAQLDKTLIYKIWDTYYFDSRMRLRKAVEADGVTTIFKLCKKYGLESRGSDPTTSIYLSLDEYEFFSSLSGAKIEKQRFLVTDQGEDFLLDIYQGTLNGLAVVEREYSTKDQLLEARSPSFALREITGEEKFSGASIAFHGKPASADS